MPRRCVSASPFKRFNSSPEVIRLVVMMYVRFPLSLRNVEDLLFERGIDICHETVRLWWNRFGPMFAADIRRQRVSRMRGFRHWKWHLDEVYVKINGEMHCLWRAVDQDGEVLESYVTKTRDRDAALQFMKKMLNAKLRGHGFMPYATMIEHFLAASARCDLLERESLARVIASAKSGRPQVDPADPTWHAVTRIFPEVFDGVRRQEMIDVSVLPAWAGG